jgi:hypothetical protein
MTSPLQQKLKIAGPVVVTANRLGDGAVVYRTRHGGWSTRLDQAAVASTAAAAGELFAEAAADDLGAVGAYVAPVHVDGDGRVRPGNLRETIRQGGPTIDLPGAQSAVPLAHSLHRHARRRASSSEERCGASAPVNTGSSACADGDIRDC